MFKLFEEIIRGKLRPDVITDDDFKKIIEITDGKFNALDQTWDTKDEFLKYYLDSGHRLLHELKERDEINRTFKIHLEDSYDEVYQINMPEPPSLTGEMYLNLVRNNSVLIKHKINSYVTCSDNINDLNTFACKNIFVLRNLAESLRLHIQTLEGVHCYLAYRDTNHFVFDVLQRYIIYFIQYIQKTFSIFGDLKIESFEKLNIELFFNLNNGTGIGPAGIYSLIPEEMQFPAFRFICPKDIDISLGKYLFQEIKERFENLSNFEKIAKYQEEIYVWNYMLITNEQKIFLNDKVIDDPEIKQVLIPLLENEIKFLETEIEKEKAYIRSIEENKDIIIDKFQTVLNKLKSSDNQKGNLLIKPDQKTLPEKNIKSFPEYLILDVTQAELKDKQKDLAEMLKNEFKTEQNIEIRCLLEALERNEPRLLVIGHRQYKKVLKSLEQYFNRRIGSYNAIQNPVFIDSKPPKSYKGIKLRLDILLLRFNKS